MKTQTQLGTHWTFFNRTAATLLLLGGLGYVVIAAAPQNAVDADKAIQSLEQTSQSFASIAKKISPSVVSLKVEKQVAHEMESGGSPLDRRIRVSGRLRLRNSMWWDKVPDS